MGAAKKKFTDIENKDIRKVVKEYFVDVENFEPKNYTYEFK